MHIQQRAHLLPKATDLPESNAGPTTYLSLRHCSSPLYTLSQQPQTANSKSSHHRILGHQLSVGEELHLSRLVLVLLDFVTQAAIATITPGPTRALQGKHNNQITPSTPAWPPSSRLTSAYTASVNMPWLPRGAWIADCHISVDDEQFVWQMVLTQHTWSSTAMQCCWPTAILVTLTAAKVATSLGVGMGSYMIWMEAARVHVESQRGCVRSKGVP